MGTGARLSSFLVVGLNMKESPRMLSQLIRPVGIAALVALLSLAACTGNRGYSGDNYGDGGYHVEQ
jgi:hypothetical protein